MALLCNDVRAAYAAGDAEFRAQIGEMVAWCYEHLPAGCHGSRAIVDRWLELHARPEPPIPSFIDPPLSRPPWPAVA
ncbi:MAG: hypothetical protein ACM31L_11685 [Actinomycetota bacterium]